MSKSFRLIFLFALSTWRAAALVTATPAHAVRPQSPAYDDKKAADLWGQICGDCHDADRIVSKRRTKMEWQDIINQMIDKGAAGTGDDFEAVYGFLQRHYGKVYVNTAPSAEIATVLGLSSTDADNLVAYRKTNGPFADLDALKKVPGIDTKQLDDHKDAVAF